jgi:hypothetical protein
MMSASSILVIVRVGAGISVVVPCKKHARFMFLIVVCGHL